jgi:hypothetical protein
MDRREFIRNSGRWIILSLLIAGAGRFIFRNRASSQNECKTNVYCNKCGFAASCTLPQAIKFRKNEKEKSL